MKSIVLSNVLNIFCVRKLLSENYCLISKNWFALRQFPQVLSLLTFLSRWVLRFSFRLVI